jgi:hypothetical protein
LAAGRHQSIRRYHRSIDAPDRVCYDAARDFEFTSPGSTSPKKRVASRKLEGRPMTKVLLFPVAVVGLLVAGCVVFGALYEVLHLL